MEKRRTAKGPTTRIIECGAASEGGAIEWLTILRRDIDKDIESSAALVVIIRELRSKTNCSMKGCKDEQ